MPFIKQDPRPFTETDILKLSKDQSGVYGIFKPNVWIYVGKGDIRDRLLQHIRGQDDNPCILRNRPTFWVAEKISGDPSQREKELILELTPACNKRIG